MQTLMVFGVEKSKSRDGLEYRSIEVVERRAYPISSSAGWSRSTHPLGIGCKASKQNQFAKGKASTDKEDVYIQDGAECHFRYHHV